MKANRFMTSDKAQTGMGGVAIGAVLALIVIGVLLYVGLSIMEGVTDSTSLSANTTATGTYTQSGISISGGNITIGTEVYNASNSTGAFEIDVGYNTTATFFVDAFVTVVNTDSTLVTAVDNGDDTATITSALGGSVGNYASTENMTNGAFGSTTLTGGVDADTFYATEGVITTGINSSFGLTSVLLLVIIAAAIIGVLMMLVARTQQ